MSIAGVTYIYHTCILYVLINQIMISKLRVDTYGNKIKVKDGVYHPKHELQDKLQNIYLSDFQNSEEMEAFRARTGRKNIGFSKFVEGAFSCPCIQKPIMRVCVDEVETEFRELTWTLKNVMRNSKVKCDCKFCENEKEKKEMLGDGI